MIETTVRNALASAHGMATVALCQQGGAAVAASQIEKVKAALESAKRAERAVEAAKDWFLRGVSVFETEVSFIKDARAQLENVVRDLTGAAEKREEVPRSPHRWEGGRGRAKEINPPSPYPYPLPTDVIEGDAEITFMRSFASGSRDDAPTTLAPTAKPRGRAPAPSAAPDRRARDSRPTTPPRDRDRRDGHRDGYRDGHRYGAPRKDGHRNND